MQIASPLPGVTANATVPSNLLWKLGVRDRTRAVLRGLELGLIPGGDPPS
jgi:ATP/maltotriose-dependent transcriptional regulator MalT